MANRTYSCVWEGLDCARQRPAHDHCADVPGCLGCRPRDRHSHPPQVSLTHDVIGWCEGEGTACCILVVEYSLHGHEVFKGFPRATVGHGRGSLAAEGLITALYQLWCPVPQQLGSRPARWALSGESLPVTRCSGKVGRSWQVLDPTCMERPCTATPRTCFPPDWCQLRELEHVSGREWAHEASFLVLCGTAKPSPVSQEPGRGPFGVLS